jgi:hypothetical protein
MTTRRYVLAALAALGGLALFVYSVREAGVGQILNAVGSIGWGLAPILGLAGLRFLLRAEAWRLCTPLGSRLTLGQAFMAFLAGDALGNVTPLGLIASEPTKVLLTRHQLATREAVASLAVDNLVYALSVIVMIAAGLVVMLVTVPLPFEIREWSLVLLVALALVCVAALLVFRRRRAPAQGPEPGWRDRLASVRQAVMDFSFGDPARLWRVFSLDLLFHALAVLEAFLTLQWLLGDRSPTLADAMMFESLNRVITVVFKFVPLRVGVDEVSSGAFASLVGVNPVAGVALAVVRKVRGLFWMGIGLLFIAVYHGRGVSVKRPPESVPAPPT